MFNVVDSLHTFLKGSPSAKSWETLTSSVILQQFWYDTKAVNNYASLPDIHVIADCRHALHYTNVIPQHSQRDRQLTCMLLRTLWYPLLLTTCRSNLGWCLLLQRPGHTLTKLWHHNIINSYFSKSQCCK